MYRAQSIFSFGIRPDSYEKQDEITQFSEKFYVQREYVVACLEHLTNLESAKNIRAKAREDEKRHRKEKECKEYSWLDLVLQGKLSTLKVYELDEYLDENKLNKKGNKNDKLKAIAADVLRRSQTGPIKKVLEKQERDQESSGADSEADSDQDIVLEEIGSESESDVASGNEQEEVSDPVPLIVRTRSGRYAGNWTLSELR